MPSTNTFDAKLKFELSQCDSLPPTSEASVVEGLGSVSNCRVVADGNSQQAVTIKPGSLPKPRLFIIRPVSATVLSKGQQPEWVETPIDGVIVRDRLAERLTFEVHISPAATTGTPAPQFPLGRVQVYYDGLIDLLVPSAPAPPVTAHLTFLFTPTASLPPNTPDPLFTPEAQAKYAEVKEIVVQVIAAYAP